jgi:Flp pilus assembly protein protease CpaA
MIVLSSILSAFVYQDFKYRAITWYLFPILFVAAAYYQLLDNTWQNWTMSFLTNNALWIIQLLLIKGYHSLRYGKSHQFIDYALGKGDVLFICVMCAAFPPLHFLLLILFAAVFALLVSLPIIYFNKEKNYPIPFAGFLAMSWMLSLLASELNWMPL